jgi:short-subunit dehydrogenase
MRWLEIFSPTSMRINGALQNKTVVITGASSGVGRVAALEFAKEGAALVLAARREEALQEVADECIALGAQAIVFPADVTDALEMEALAEAADDFGDGIDVWVNNAGVLAVGPFDETPSEVNTRVVETNLLGYMNGAHAALPYFKQQGYGVLINNISVGGWMATPYGVAYTASKFGLRGFCEALQAELSPWPGIHVCAMYPAFLNTPGIQHAANYTGTRLKPAPPVFDPRRVAHAMVHLAKHPQRSYAPDAAAPLMRIGYALAPRLVGTVAEVVMRGYFQRGRPASDSSGNLYDAGTPGTSIHGGWNRERAVTKVSGILAVAAGLSALVAIVRRARS